MARSVGRAFWSWYRNLTLVPMFMVTCLAGVTLWMFVEQLPVAAGEQAQLHRLLGSALVCALLIVLLVGLLRGRRQ